MAIVIVVGIALIAVVLLANVSPRKCKTCEGPLTTFPYPNIPNGPDVTYCPKCDANSL
jgi:hypothetical protein